MGSDRRVVPAEPGWFVVLARVDEAESTVTVDLRPVASWHLHDSGVMEVATVWPGGSARSVPLPDGVHVLEVGSDITEATMPRFLKHARSDPHLSQHNVVRGKVLTPSPRRSVPRLGVVRDPK